MKRILCVLTFFFLALTFAWSNLVPAARAFESPPNISFPALHAPTGGVVTICDQTNLVNALAGGGTVTFTCSGTIVLTSTLLITAPTTLDGAGQAVAISGNDAYRIITTTAGVNTLILQNITLTKGIAITTTGGHGGALFVRGALVLSNTTVISNSATGQGGGAYVTNTLTLTNAQFISNTATSAGGGASANGTVTMNGGLFRNNTSASSGGGLNSLTHLTLNDAQFISNTASNSGGAMDGRAHHGYSTDQLEMILLARSMSIRTNWVTIAHVDEKKDENIQGIAMYNPATPGLLSRRLHTAYS